MRHYTELLRATLTALLMLVAVVGATVAGPLEDASVAFERRDFATALRLLRPLADQGNAIAQFILGVMYDNGKGVPQNDAEAMKWYRAAADRGETNAQCNLGTMYLTGQGVPQDYAEALKWYRKAADQGNASAQFNLGKMYDNGQGVPQDYVQAHLWLDLAASQFSASEKEKRDHAIKYRNLVSSKMTPAQIGEAQKLAREWKPKPER
jgi:TPR repeat protein